MDRLKTFKRIMEKSDSNRVIILTNHYQIKGNVYDCGECNRDALRAMLEVGTKRFSAKMLYTFIHMFNYDDPKEFNDMII